MSKKLISWLIESGLDEQRAKLYLTALSFGEATAKELADEMKMRRTAIYDNLQILEKRGYVRLLHRGKRKIYFPLSPKELYKKFENQKRQLQDLMPDFLAHYAEESRQPFVQIFEGPHAVREVFEDILKVAKKEYVFFSPPQLTLDRVNKSYLEDWIKRRVKQGIWSRSLRAKGGEFPKEPIFNEETEYLRSIRYLPMYLDVKGSIYIYENKIGMVSTKRESFSFIVQSPDLAYSLKKIFEFIWGVSMKS